MFRIPTCQGNALGGAQNLCLASQTCVDPTNTRYWVFVAYPRPTGGYGDPVRQAGDVCLADAEAPDPLPFIVDLVANSWKDFDLPGWGMTIRPPSGRVLVNVPTKFASNAPTTVTIPPVNILGRDVTVTLKAVTHVWDFGDGETGASLPGNPKIEHAHRKDGPFEVVMTTRYTATFTVQGSAAVYDGNGTADVAGPGTPLEVVEAHSELIAGNS